MALFHCPVCGLPLTDAEARLASCAICGGALQAPAPVAASAAAASAPTAHVGPRRRLRRWIIGGCAATALAILLFLLWQWGGGLADLTADPAAAQAAVTIAKAEPAPEHVAAQPAPPAPKLPGGGDRAEVAYPSLAASAKAPGDDIVDGDVGARAKPAGQPKRDEPPPPRIADKRPVPVVPDLQPFAPQMPAFPNGPFPGIAGGGRIADNDIDQLLRMALTQKQELEKLFNMAGMQDLDLLGAARAIQGFGKLQGPGARRPLLGGLDGAVPAAASGDVGEMVLTGNGITDRDLERLRGQGKLRALTLAGTAVTDAGLEHLKGLKGLRRLNLSGTRVTDKGLEALAGLTELRELDLSNTRITGAGSKRLQQALPNLEVTR